MKLIDHTLIQNGSPLHQATSSLPSGRRRKALESVDLVIIRTSQDQLTQHTDHINEHIVEPTSHVLINRDGLIIQSIPFNEQVGKPLQGSWEGMGDLTSRSVVIALQNSGRLSKTADIYSSSCGRSFDATEVFTGIHQNEESLSYWQKFSESQIQVAEKIIRCLASTYQVKYILGNEEVCPGLKTDPGPAFPLEILRRKIMKENMLHQTGKFDGNPVTGRFDLNAILGKQQQDASAKRAAKIVNIRKKSGGWYKVNIDLGGFIKEEWVSI